VQRRAAEAQLVGVWITVERLADSFGVRLDLVRFQTPRSDRGHMGIKIVATDFPAPSACSTM
jgi:hypothetical protein